MEATERDINLQPLPISDILDKQFFIPHYQRGYRWTEYQVKQLLDDIESFNPREIIGKPNEKTFYCLQPVVVKLISDEKKNELRKNQIDLKGDWYEVIDGQQRLTTIYIILQYINQKWLGEDKLDQFKINFETRVGCVDFLEQLNVNKDNIVDINTENIDFYHISKALQTIRTWQLDFAESNNRKLDTAGFQSNFTTSAKIIWYNISDSILDGRPLFERLNLGKIPLTNAELTKALFLSSESFTDIAKEEQKIKQYEIAHLWDEIEYKLNEPDSKFWSFITNKDRSLYETKIDVILDLITGKTSEDKDPLFTFIELSKKQKESSGLTKVWEEIEHFYFTLSQWFIDKEYYHKIGYLVTARQFKDFKGVDLGHLIKEARVQNKQDFNKGVDALISASVCVELSELRYKSHYNQIFNVLLLFNVETNRTSNAINEFYPFKQHKSNFWSLEHIHARNSENFDKSKREPWNKWLDLHRSLLLELKTVFEADKNKIAENLIEEIDKYNNELLTWDRFSTLFNTVNDFFTLDNESLDKDSEGVSNLALLSQPDNSALNNSVFEVKRRDIIRLDKEGSFIPVCTRRAFLKYYIKDNTSTQTYFWSKEDRDTYFEELSKTLEDFLPLNFIEEDTDEN